MEKSDQDNHRDGCGERRDIRKHPLQIRSEGHGTQGHRRGEADHDGDDAGHKAEGRMENLPEKVIFPAGARKGGREFGVAKGPAQGKDAPEAPEDHDRGARGDVTDLEAETGEDTGADHIGHDQSRAGRQADGAWSRHVPGWSACA